MDTVGLLILVLLGIGKVKTHMKRVARLAIWRLRSCLGKIILFVLIIMLLELLLINLSLEKGPILAGREKR